MSDKSNISWTDATWNPWQGCGRKSSGCANCYMFTAKKRYGQDPSMVVRSSDKTFYAPLKWEPSLIFVCSWSDFFIKEADEWRGDAWDVIRQTPQHSYQLLTKRPERIKGCLPDDWGDGWPHVWLGVSVEDQRAADERIPLLLQTPAAVRFISAEPLLEAVTIGLAGTAPKDWGYGYTGIYNLLHWVIVGAESGPNRRPFEVAWAEDIYDECEDVDVPFYGKQGPAHKPGAPLLIHGEVIHEMPGDAQK